MPQKQHGSSSRSLEVEQVALSSLTPHPMNPRRGNLDKIVDSIRANGFYGVIVAQKSTGHILAGNHRWLAARQLGMESVPVMWLAVSDAQAKKILLADNRTSDLAEYATEDLHDLLQSVLADGDMSGTGYDAADVDALIDALSDTPNEKRKRNLEPFHDTFFLIRCPISEHGKVNAILEEALRGVAGAEFASATN